MHVEAGSHTQEGATAVPDATLVGGSPYAEVTGLF